MTKNILGYLTSRDYTKIYDVATTIFILCIAVIIIATGLYHGFINHSWWQASTLLYPAFATAAEGMLCSVWASGGLFRLVLAISAVFNLLLWG
jgi:hypothetical protein